MAATVGTVHVLHVDDEPEFAELVATFLEREDDRLAVRTAESATEGLELLADHEVDCIVSDYDMPGRNGIEFLDTVRDRAPDLPFILYTGKGSEAVASDAISAGVTDYLQKGSGTEQYELLANRITNAVEATQSRRILEERTRRLETLISNLPGVVYRCRNEPGWPMEVVEGEVEALTGYTATELEENEVNWGEEVLHPEDRLPVWEEVQESLEADGTFEVVYRILARDGTTKWMWERGRLVEMVDGDEPVLEGFITEITDRKEREERLERTTARLEALFANSPDMINVHDAAGNLIDPNPRLSEKTGYDEAELTGMKVWELDQAIDPEEASALWESMDAGDRERIEGVYQRRDGTTFPVEIHLQRLDLSDEDRFIAISRDVTEREEREQELTRQNDLFRRAQAIADVGAWNYDLRTGEIFLTEKAYEIHGLTPDAGMNPEKSIEFYHPEDQPVIREAFERAVHEGEPYDVEVRLVDADGTQRWVRTRGDPEIEDGRIVRVRGTIQDVTDRKQREQERKRQNDRLEEFASVVSHDLRTPLETAEGRLELARESPDSEHLDGIGTALDRMRDIVDDVLWLAREGREVGSIERVDLREAVESAWTIAADGASGAEMVVAGDGTLPTVEADREQLRQALENLFRNAVEHGRGALTVTVGELDDGFYVEDDGPGIEAEYRDRVFDDGYSTSEEGTGFGLSIVEQVVEAHGWEIGVTDGPEGGARFEVTGVTVTEQ